jgi:hypothetical protein
LTQLPLSSKPLHSPIIGSERAIFKICILTHPKRPVKAIFRLRGWGDLAGLLDAFGLEKAIFSGFRLFLSGLTSMLQKPRCRLSEATEMLQIRDGKVMIIDQYPYQSCFL